MTCVQCGTALPEGALFCGECGHEVTARRAPAAGSARPLACGQCGAAMKPEEIFCGECGYVARGVERSPAAGAGLPATAAAMPLFASVPSAPAPAQGWAPPPRLGSTSVASAPIVPSAATPPPVPLAPRPVAPPVGSAPVSAPSPALRELPTVSPRPPVAARELGPDPALAADPVTGPGIARGSFLVPVGEDSVPTPPPPFTRPVSLLAPAADESLAHDEPRAGEPVVVARFDEAHDDDDDDDDEPSVTDGGLSWLTVDDAPGQHAAPAPVIAPAPVASAPVVTSAPAASAPVVAVPRTPVQARPAGSVASAPAAPAFPPALVEPTEAPAPAQLPTGPIDLTGPVAPLRADARPSSAVAPPVPLIGTPAAPVPPPPIGSVPLGAAPVTPVPPAPVASVPVASVPVAPAPLAPGSAAELPVAPEWDDVDEEDLESTRITAQRPLGGSRFVLQFSTGESVTVFGTGLVGRNPQPQPGEYFDQLVRILDHGKSVSKTHLEFGQEAGVFWVSDRFSGNGTIVREPDVAPRRADAGRRYRVARGTRIEIGEQFFVLS